MNEQKDREEKSKGIVKSVEKVIERITQRKNYKGFGFLESEEKERIISSQQIRSILPHRGRFLLLDEVLITSQKITGKIKVTEDMCLGHAVLKGEMIFRGSDFSDMAAQLLTVWAAQWPELRFSLEGKICVPVEYGGSIFRMSVFPGDLVLMSSKEVQARERTNRISIVGEKFTAEVEGKSQKENVTVSLVKLLALKLKA